ncbi:hypothetical protein Tco_0117403 [Tanacetum coccineum]
MDSKSFNQRINFAVAVSSVPSIVDAYLANKMHKAVKTAVQLQSERLRDEAQAKNADFLNKLDDNIKKIIKDQVKEQVKAQVSKILLKIKKTAGESAHAEEPMHTAKDLKKPAHQEFKIGFTDDQPNEETSQLPDCFLKPTKPPTPDRDWSKTLPDAHGPVQPWLSSLAQMEDPRESIDTPLEFPAFVMNRLKVDTLTPELLAGPTFELMKGSCKSLVELEYFFEEVYKATTDQLDWNNPEECFTRSVCHPKAVEDHPLGVEKTKKLNSQSPETIEPYLKRREAYTAYSNPRGFIYQNKDKKNRLMRIDELHKFSNGTLNDVQTALNDHL